MESPTSITHSIQSPLQSAINLPAHASSSKPHRTPRLSGMIDDPNTLTSSNPFAEEDELEESSSNILSSFMSKVKSMSAPLSSVMSTTSSSSGAAALSHQHSALSLGGAGGGPPSVATSASQSTTGATAGPSYGPDSRRASFPATIQSTSTISTKATAGERPQSLLTAPSQIAPPLVSRAELEFPTFSMMDLSDRSSSQRPGSTSSVPFEQCESGFFGGTAIPGFPIQDDTRSIKTSTSFHRSRKISKAIRRARGEGLSKGYWMDDATAEFCFSCGTTFTAWRRKHHCRICGQIFCGRCASSLIDGYRFGEDGTIRVCVLCLNDDAKNDDDDDRMSVVSSVTGSFPLHQQFGQFSAGDAAFPSSRVSSPYQTSYNRNSIEPFNAISIAEARHQRHYFGTGSEGTASPYFDPAQDGPRYWDAMQDNPAPFRRAMSDDDGDPPPGLPIPTSALLNHSESGLPVSESLGSNRVEFPSSSSKQPLNVNVSFNSVPFPGGMVSPTDSPRPESRNAFSRPFYGDYEPSTPFVRSRVQSRLDSVMMGEPGWRTRKDSIRYAELLNQASQKHLRAMLEQMLRTEGIQNIEEWEEVLVKLAMKIARELTFASLPVRQGQDMDVRRYVKIKKVPGGAPKDSEYVDGAVITKNVAHKRMARKLKNARVMLITFPLEFNRVDRGFHHLPTVVKQEENYLTNLAARIAALSPRVVLVEKMVNGQVLQELLKKKIAVARNVKPSAVQAVARMTGGSVFGGMDKLAQEGMGLGECRDFRIQTFDHHLIPGRRKTLMRFEGPRTPDRGCTIILRGGDMETLRKIKKVARFMTFVVRNLKLETHLHWGTFLSLSTTGDPDPLPGQHSRHVSSLSTATISPATSNFEGLNVAEESVQGTPMARITSLENEEEDKPEGREEEKKEQQMPHSSAITARIVEALEPYQKTFISASATLQFPPPYPILRMKELDDELTALKRASEAAAAKLAEEKEQKMQKEILEQQAAVTVAPAPVVAATNVHELEQQQQQQGLLDQDDISAQIDALPSTLAPPSPGGLVPSTTPYLSPASMTDMESYFSPLSSGTPGFPNQAFLNASFSSAVAPGERGESVEEEEPLKFVEVEDLDVTGALNAIEWKHQEYQRYWEWYLRKNKDDFVVEKYQYIYLREYTVPSDGLDTSRPCFPPTLQHILFYGENDLTLGQFIEKSVNDSLVQFLDPKAICQGKACDQPLARHAKVFVHNSTRVAVTVERVDPHAPEHRHWSPHTFYTYSHCRECAIETSRLEVIEEVLRYSFAKFLEAYFYPSSGEMVPAAPGCPHNMYQHHLRFFAFQGMRIRFQADPIVLKELIFPPTRIYVRRETQLEIKNRDFEQILQRNDRWYQGLIGDLTQYAMEASTGEDQELDQRTLMEINNRITMAEVERKNLKKFIHQVYHSTKPTDTLAIVKVFAHRQEKVVKWQQDFEALQAQRLDRSEFQGRRDRKSKTSAFGSVRAIWKYDLTGKLYEGSHFSANVSEAEDGASVVSSRRGTLDSLISSASDFSETESTLNSALTASGDTELKLEAEVKEKQAEPVIGEAEGSVAASGHAELNAKEKTSAEVPAPDATDLTESASQVTELEQAPPSTDDVPLVVPAIEISESEADKPEENHSSDPDSDSTIEAVRFDPRSNIQVAKALQKKKEKKEESKQVPTVRPSRLPRRASQPNVDALVRHFSEYLPAQGVRELAKTALAPMSESEQDSEYPTFIPRRSATRTKSKQMVRKASTSDFEQGYAANVVPRLLTRQRKPWGSSSALNAAGNDSQPGSRMHSPEKRGSYGQLKGKDRLSRPGSPTRRASSTRPSKIRVTSQAKDRAFPGRQPPSASKTSTFRKPQTTGRVTNIAKQYERMGRESERAKPKYTVLRGKRARPVVSSKANIEILSGGIKDVIKDEPDSSDSSEADDEADVEEDAAPKGTKHSPPPELTDSPADHEPPAVADSNEKGAATSPAAPPDGGTPGQDITIVSPSEEGRSLPVSPLPETLTTPMRSEVSDTESYGPRFSGALSDTESTTGPGISLLNAISGWLPAPVVPDDALGDSEIIFDSEMVVRLDEPTSIIALALNSKKYRELLQQSRQERLTAAHASLSEGSEAFMPDDRSTSDSTSTWGVVTTGDPQDASSNFADPNLYSSTPWMLTFPHTGLEISCTVLYPEQFDSIRRLFDCETSIVESLARCVKWKAGGGKSGSAFLKTQDDRFIAKGLSRSELQTMETFTPQYHKYVQSCFDAERPTLLAKIFGCYKVTYRRSGQERGSGKSRTTQMNLLIMENLFYDRRFERIYDLKGSTRNRHVKSTGKENEVLLDENLVEASHTNPFYLREHSKRILRGALYNDSKFLSDLNVMDYSLVCGVDEKNNELVLGIVDYIRTYTWDKKLETWVKESAFLGAGKGEPTIVTPKQYRQRFLSAMERYFPLVPDRWMKIKDTPEEDSACLAELWPDW